MKIFKDCTMFKLKIRFPILSLLKEVLYQELDAEWWSLNLDRVWTTCEEGKQGVKDEVSCWLVAKNCCGPINEAILKDLLETDCTASPY